MIGSRRRILCKQDGSCVFLVVRRLRCLECERISHELPDIVVPYKHHELDTIADGLVEDDSLARKSCPAEVSTINRWKHWFFSSHIFFEESLRTLQEQSSTVLHLSFPLFPRATSQVAACRHLATAARVKYPAALQRCKFDTPLLAAGSLIPPELSARKLA